MSELIGCGIVVLIFISAIRSHSKKIKQKEELEQIYAKLPEEDVATIKKAIKQSQNEEGNINLSDDIKQRNDDSFYSPMYNNYQGNIHNK